MTEPTRVLEVSTAAGPPPTRLELRDARVSLVDRRFAYVTSYVPLLGALAAISSPLFGLPVGWAELALLVVMYSLTTIGLEVGFHRHLSHRSFRASPLTRRVFAVLGSMACQGPVVWWVATHRRHHACSDREGDPHSPRPAGPGLLAAGRGLVEAHSRWTFDRERARPVGWDRYAKDLYRDEAVFRVHVDYFWWMIAGLLAPAAIGGIVHMSFAGAVSGFLWGGLLRVFLVDHAVRALNSLAHVFGTRSFDTDDLSRNNVLLVLPTFGQGWHHNHHAFPGSATTSFAWWQIDPGAWVIQALEWLGLVWKVKTVSPADRAVRTNAA